MELLVDTNCLQYRNGWSENLFKGMSENSCEKGGKTNAISNTGRHCKIDNVQICDMTLHEKKVLLCTPRWKISQEEPRLTTTTMMTTAATATAKEGRSCVYKSFPFYRSSSLRCDAMKYKNSNGRIYCQRFCWSMLLLEGKLNQRSTRCIFSHPNFYGIRSGWSGNGRVMVMNQKKQSDRFHAQLYKKIVLVIAVVTFFSGNIINH